MAIGDDGLDTQVKESEVLEDIILNAQVQDPLVDSFRDMDETTISYSPYRAYMPTSPQYIPGRGVSRYMPSLKNLIPVRKSSQHKKAIAVDKAGLFAFIFYTWISPFMYKAYKTGLKAEDLPQGSPLDSCDLNAQRLELLWQEEVAQKGPRGASFSSAVWKFVRTRVLISCLLFSLSLSMGFISPTIFMRKLLQYAETEDGDVWTGVTWAVCLTLVELLRIVFFAWNWALNYRTAIRLRSACLAVLYRKVIRLNSLGDRSIGELINIFANDGQRIFDMILFGPMIIGGPLVTLCGVFYIYWLLGPWAILGMATFLIFYPTQYGISRLTSYLRGKTVVVSDQRVKLMTEILNCIKFIKMCAWERNFSESIFKIRSQERSLLQKTSYCQSLSISLASTVPVISAIVTFLAHITAGNNLTAAQAFPVAALFGNQLKDALSRIREGSKAIYDTFVSCSRIKNILILDDIKPYISRPIDKSEAVHIIGGTFAWNTVPIHDADLKLQEGIVPKTLCQQSKPGKHEREKLNPGQNVEAQYVNILYDIHFQVRKGKLVGVCGHVGSGKTSLLLSCLGQMRLISGQVTRDGSTAAYVSQEAWILNATLRDNILFGERFEAKRYYEALYNCCLSDDINMLPGGDQTEIGERGINLSGGQKQRVALARALYANRDTYFLDDPLSAVDSHVGAHIFSKCIQTALRNKTVVLVTHQVQYLNNCDEIYMLRYGHIIEHGTHEQLMVRDEEYALMVKTCMLEKEPNDQSKGESVDLSNTESAQSIRARVERAISSSSYHSTKETEKMNPAVGEQLMVAETIEQGHIRFATYHSYISAAGGVCVALLVYFCFFLNVGSTAFSSWWLATWIKAGGGNATHIVNNETVYSNNINDNPDLHMYRLVYGVTIVVIMGTSLLRGFAFTQATLRASTSIHNRLFSKIMHCPLQFFETTPIGRIQNLFSRDMDEVDARLPITVESILQNMWIVLFAMLFICLVFPWFIIPLTVLTVMYHFISKIFRVAVRDLKRLENVSRSPIFSCVGTTVQGLSTIHAFGKENEFITRFTQMFDENSTCLYLCCVASRWLAVRIDSLAVSILCITAFLIIALHNQVPPALAGLALAYSAHISGVFQYTIRLISETEVRFISVERMNSYLQNLTCEGSSGGKTKPPPNWPSQGKIKFQNVSLRYRDGLPTILKDISFSVNAGEKIGIVGRTGSGKSSLVVALFRLVELSSGRIKVDGVDIADITLEQLRTCLSVIPQDPVLFAGTIRSNLDPLGLYSDAEVWEALEKTKLREKVKSISGQLHANVGQSGDNFSVGERQLLCLARALLRNAKILVLDEATASVDPETEAAVQTTIQREFHNCTVITIAHRLTTVTSCDQILVMAQGQVLELDTPANLLADHQSQFYKMFSVAEAAVKGAMSPANKAKPC